MGIHQTLRHSHFRNTMGNNWQCWCYLLMDRTKCTALRGLWANQYEHISYLLTFQGVDNYWLDSVSVATYTSTAPAGIMYTTLIKMPAVISFSVQSAKTDNWMQSYVLLFVISGLVSFMQRHQQTKVLKRLRQSCSLWFDKAAQSDPLNRRFKKRELIS